MGCEATRKLKITGLTTTLLLTLPLLAQTSVKDDLAKHWKTSGEFTLAVAKSMPPESYNFRPTPEEMSFGQLMAHIGAANVGACANASGQQRPPFPEKIAAWAKEQQKTDVDKDTALQFLTDVFAFCDKSVSMVNPEKLGETSGRLNRFEWLWGYFTHTAHHRGQAEVYLRLKGIKPPDYKF